MNSQLVNFLNTTNPEILDAFLQANPEFKNIVMLMNNNNMDILQELSTKIPFFEGHPDFFQDQEKTILISGLVQSGKTAVICGLAIYYLKVAKKPVIVVLRNCTADNLQLLKNFQQDGRFEEFNINICYVGDKNVDSTQFFSHTKPTLTVCIDNQTQYKKLLDAHNNTGHPEFHMIVDEVDMIAYKKPNEKKVTFAKFNQLKDASSKFIGITATIYSMAFMEEKLNCSSIYTLPIPENYKGIDHPDLSIVELPDSFVFKQNMDGVYALSEDIELFYKNFLNEPVIDIDEKEFHPLICLQRTTDGRIKDNQMIEMNSIAVHPVFGKHLTVLVYNGEGVYVYHKNKLPSNINNIKAKPYSDVFISGITYYQKAGVSDVLQYMKDNNMNGQYHHIVIIAGYMVGRGINVSSSDYGWHLTHQLLEVSSTADCSDMVQACRVFGIYNDDIKIKLYCKKQDALAIRQAHYLQNRIIEGASEAEINQILKDEIPNIKVLAGHIPVRALTKKCKRPKFNKVLEITEEESMEEDREWGMAQFRTILARNIANRNSTIIIKILKYILENYGGGVEFSSSVLINKAELCRDLKINVLLQYTRWNKKHGDYKVLIDNGETVSLNPEIISILEQYVKDITKLQ